MSVPLGDLELGDSVVVETQLGLRQGYFLAIVDVVERQRQLAVAGGWFDLTTGTAQGLDELDPFTA